jgi:hypothetical protein
MAPLRPRARWAVHHHGGDAMSAATVPTATDLAATLRLLSETTTPGEWVVEDAEEASGDMRALLVGTDDGGPVEIAYVHMDESVQR